MPFDAVRAPGPKQTADLARLSTRLICEVVGYRANHEIPPPAIPVELVAEIAGRAWMMGAEVALQVIAGERACRICGCTQDRACTPPCSWVAQDLCSACLMKV